MQYICYNYFLDSGYRLVPPEGRKPQKVLAVVFSFGSVAIFVSSIFLLPKLNLGDAEKVAAKIDDDSKYIILSLTVTTISSASIGEDFAFN